MQLPDWTGMPGPAANELPNATYLALGPSAMVGAGLDVVDDDRGVPVVAELADLPLPLEHAAARTTRMTTATR